nr:hypothetical protein [uncultured Albidiferax sp.]
MKTALLSSCVLGVGLLTGCASLVPNMRDSTVSKFGPGGLVTQPIEQVDLISLVTNGASKQQTNATEALKKENFPNEFEAALATMRGQLDSTSGVPVKDLKYERNRIQDRLIMVSNDLCEEYKTVLKRKQSNANFFYGLTSVLAGAAGSVAAGARAAGNWAAVSGAASGVRAEHNQDFYADMAAHVIAKGIVLKRRVIADAMQCARQYDEKDYSVERAIADAVVYHGACSLIGGLESMDHVMSTLNVNVGTDALAANQFFNPYVSLRNKQLLGDGATAAPAATPASAPVKAAFSGSTEVNVGCVPPK